MRGDVPGGLKQLRVIRYCQLSESHGELFNCDVENKNCGEKLWREQLLLFGFVFSEAQSSTQHYITTTICQVKISRQYRSKEFKSPVLYPSGHVPTNMRK